MGNGRPLRDPIRGPDASRAFYGELFGGPTRPAGSRLTRTSTAARGGDDPGASARPRAVEPLVTVFAGVGRRPATLDRSGRPRSGPIVGPAQQVPGVTSDSSPIPM